MPIIRKRQRDDNYSVIPNGIIRDTDLSFRARGVLVEILSHDDGWDANADVMAAGTREGRDALRTVFAELEAAGYLHRTVVRGADGRVSKRVTVHDHRCVDAACGGRGTSNLTRHQSASQPTTDFQASVPPAQ